MKWSTLLSENKKHDIIDIETKLQDIDTEISQTTDKGTLSNLILRRKQFVSQQDQYYKKSAEGAQIRARAKWIEDDERNNRYFMNLEKKKANK